MGLAQLIWVGFGEYTNVLWWRLGQFPKLAQSAAPSFLAILCFGRMGFFCYLFGGEFPISMINENVRHYGADGEGC